MNSAVARVVELEEVPATAGPLRPFDVRLRREPVQCSRSGTEHIDCARAIGEAPAAIRR